MHEALTPTQDEKAGLAELTKGAEVADEGGSAAAFDDLKELNTFSAQEDQAIAGQLDGEAVVNEIGKSLGKSINPDVKNGNAHWAKKQKNFMKKQLGAWFRILVNNFNRKFNYI